MKRVLVAVVCLAGSAQYAHAIPVTYNSNAEQLLFSSADAPDQPDPFTPGDCPDCPFEITNNTGTTWTDFHFELRLGDGSFGTFFFVDFVGGGYDGTVYEGPGVGVVSNFNSLLDVTGINIPNGDVYSLNLDMDAFELFGTYELFGTPTTDGIVPEPGTLALLGTAVALFAVRRKHRSHPLN